MCSLHGPAPGLRHLRRKLAPAPMPGVPMLLGHPVDSKPASQGSLTLETVTVKGARDPGLATSSCLSKTLPRSPSGRASPGKK